MELPLGGSNLISPYFSLKLAYQDYRHDAVHSTCQLCLHFGVLVILVVVVSFVALVVRTVVHRAGSFKQSMGAWEPSRNRFVVPARQATEAGGIHSLESIPGLLKSLKIPSQ